MAKVKTAMMKAAMAGLYHTGAHRLLAPYTQGTGLIFTLHHVRPEPAEPKAFAPNRILEVTPEFLDAVLDQVEDAGLDVITLDEAVERLEQSEAKRFVCFTFDDGYRDNLQYAYPMFKRRGLPFTLYVPTNYPDGHGELWWMALEEIVARTNDGIAVDRDGETWRLPTATPADQERAFEQVYWWLRATRRGSATPRHPRACRTLRRRPEHGVPRRGDDLGRDQDHGLRSARHHRRPYQGPFRHRQIARA